MERPDRAVAFLGTPMGITGMKYLIKGLELTYGKDLWILPVAGGFWILMPEGEGSDGTRSR